MESREIVSTDLCFTNGTGYQVVKQVRFEDMSPIGRLEVLRQRDGDVIVSVITEDGAQAHVEFTTPMSGGGNSEHTWKALVALYEAMKADNDERPQTRQFSQ